MPPASWQVFEVERAPAAVERALNDWLEPLELTEEDLDQVRRDPCFSQELSWHAERGLLSVKLQRSSCDGAYPWASTQYLTLSLATGAPAKLEAQLTPAGRDFVRQAIAEHLADARELALDNAVANEEHDSATAVRAVRDRFELATEIATVFADGCYSPQGLALDPFFVVDERGLEIPLCSFPHAVQAWAPRPLRLSWKQLEPYLASNAR